MKMNFKKLFLFPVLYWGIAISLAANIVPLPHLMKPDSITIDNNEIFITDRATISIYSLKDVKLLKHFGRRGEGPQEFNIMPAYNLGLRISILPGYILVNSIGKVSLFSREGTFIKEVKLKTNIQEFKPLGEKFVGYGQAVADKIFYLTINLYNADFEIEKEIYRKDWYAQTEKNFNPIYLASGITRRALYHTSGSHLLVEGENGEIVVFDRSGKKLCSIAHDYGKLEITDAHKKAILKKFEKTPNIFRIAKQRGKFPAYFPLRYFTVAGNNVYVLTYNQPQEGASEFYIFDLKGNFLKKAVVPFKDTGLLSHYPYTVSSGRIYQLVEDDDSEEWQLHINVIK